VVDSNGKQVPAGETGELIVKSPVNLVGYLERPGAKCEMEFSIVSSVA
jgi:non-ribosomal peptide synthetase component E (peptide arylation enzyme)